MAAMEDTWYVPTNDRFSRLTLAYHQWHGCAPGNVDVPPDPPLLPPLDHNAYLRCAPLQRDPVLPVDPVPDVHILPDATPYLPTRISAGSSSADPSPPPMSVAITHLMVVRSGWGLGVSKPVVVLCPLVCIPARIHRRGGVSSAMSAAVVTAVAGTLTLMLEGGRMVVSNNPAAMVMAAGSVADSRLDKDDDPAAPAISEAAASSMLEKGKGKKNWYSGVIRGSMRYYNSVWAVD
jgi:hypothetical protein